MSPLRGVGSVDPMEAGLDPDAPVGTVDTTGSRVLVRSDATRAWQRVDIDHVRAGQSRAYADSVYEYLVTFTGGSPSTIRGWHLPFGFYPPYSDGPKEGRQLFDRHSGAADPWAERKKEHDDRIKNKIKALVFNWNTDSTAGEKRTMGGSWLETFACVERGPAHSTWRVVIKSPWMD